jgi:hypothetical protein
MVHKNKMRGRSLRLLNANSLNICHVSIFSSNLLRYCSRQRLIEKLKFREHSVIVEVRWAIGGNKKLSAHNRRLGPFKSWWIGENMAVPKIHKDHRIITNYSI